MTNCKPFRIVFFGDSICVGQGISLCKSWVTRIAQELDALGNKYSREIEVVNSSINGRITRQALEDMPYQVQSGGIDALLIQFGMNDCNYWETDQGLPRVSKRAFSANLKEMVIRGRRFGAKTVLLNNNHPTSRNKIIFPNTNLTYQQSNEEYCQIIRELAVELGDEIIFNDVEAYFNKQLQDGRIIDDYLLADGLHLNESGHKVYHEFLSPVINKAISTRL